MPYTPPKLIPTAPPMVPPSAFTGLTNGAVNIPNYSAHLNAIILELNTIAYYMSPVGAQEPQSVASTLLALKASAELQAKATNELKESFAKIESSLDTIARSIEVSTTGLANISTTMNNQLITQQVALAQQIESDTFQIETTNAAREEAGLPKIEPKEQTLQERAQAAIDKVTNIQQQVFAAGLVSRITTEVVSGAYKTSVEWAGQTAFGSWVKFQFEKKTLQFQLYFAKDKAVVELRNKLVELENKRR
jgi:hypothetical protein